MSQFYRAIRLVLALLGFALGLAFSLAAYFARLMINPTRQRLWASPADIGLPYQDIHFPAHDGVRLAGWFIPTADEVRPTVVLVHGWPWNRLGTAAETMLDDISGASPVDFLRLILALHRAGYHVMTFDLRNHGRSAAAPPVTFGYLEANDLIGAMDYLGGRQDVAQHQIGVVGFSMGANTVLYTLPRRQGIKAAVVVQPVSANSFAYRYGADLLGPFVHLVLPITKLFYHLAGGLRLSALEPIFAASGAGNTPVLYVQGTGDRWGRVQYVAQMAALTPRAADPVLIETQHRFGGYQHVINNPEIVLDFLQKHLTVNQAVTPGTGERLNHDTLV
jgi:uncharacterized protein